MRPLRVSWLLLAFLAAACSGEPGERSLGPACAEGLLAAEGDLEAARAKGSGDSVDWTRAASLIGAARVQQGFGEYQNCLLKTRDARAYLRALQG